VANTLSLSDLINKSYTTINDDIFYLINTSHVDPTFQVIQLTNIQTYATDTIDNLISSNQFYAYLAGTLQYNLSNTNYENWGQMIDDERMAYVQLYTTLNDVQSIGINDQMYADYYNQFQLFNLPAEINASTHFITRSLNNFYGINPTSYKTPYTFLNVTGNNDLNIAILQILLYFKTTISAYKINITNINFIDTQLNLDKFYSDINGFYNYIINTIKPSVISLFANPFIGRK
jgi:hypothetical protein